MFAFVFSRHSLGLVAGVTLAVATASAQQSPFDPHPRQFQPGNAPLPSPGPLPPPVVPIDPFNSGARPDPRNLSATAAFEPSTVRLMRFGEYRVTITGTRGNVELPDPLPTPEGLIVELSQRSTGMSIVNGQRVDNTTLRYSVTAARPGTYVLPSYTANVAGIAVTVPAAQVTVQEPGPTDLPYQSAHAVIDLPEGIYYVGQTLPAKLLVFDTPDETVQGITNVSKPTGDFLFQSTPTSRRDRITWDGKQVNALVMPLRLTPIKPGETDVTLQAIVYVNKMSAMGRASGNTAQAMLDTPPVRVIVRPLPEQGKKPGFSGGIGKFELGQPKLSASEVIVGDPVTLTVTLSGEGNLEAISPPAVSENPEWQSFTPTGDVVRDPVSQRGTKTITYTLIPRLAQTRAVPAIPLSVFDPEKGEYIDLTIPPIPIVVKPVPTDPAAEPPKEAPETPADANVAAAANQPAKAPEPILTGLAEIPGTLNSALTPALWNPFFWWRQILPAGALLGLWIWRRRVDYLAAHPEVVRRRAARRAAKQHLHRARSAAERRDSDGFVVASIDAIRAAAAPLDTTQAESLVFSEVLSNVPPELGLASADSTVRRLFERSHAARFSGHAVETDGVFSMLPEVERTVASIEKRQP